jgi:hypothetical protein
MVENNKTIIRPPAPRFGINEIVYIRESALNGYLEPRRVEGIRYDASIGRNLYEFNFKKSSPTVQTVGDAVDLKTAFTIEIIEEELLTFEEAVRIKRDYLQRELAKAEAQLAQFTSGPEIKILGNGMPIDSGDLTPGPEDDFTNFGEANVPRETTFSEIDQGQVVRVFDVVNSGDVSVNILSIQLVGDSDFEIISTPLTPLPPGTGTQLRISFRPFILGRRVATVVINSDDQNSPYVFVIEGTGV